MAWEGDKGEGWETEREKKYIELICLWEFCLWFIETVRQLKERMLQTQGRVSTRNQERQSETIFQMSNCRGQQNAELWLYPVSSANWTCMFLQLHVLVTIEHTSGVLLLCFFYWQKIFSFPFPLTPRHPHLMKQDQVSNCSLRWKKEE